MSYQNGHIFAPVNTDDVKMTIGINSDDIGTLCTAEDSINEYSLIRPLYTMQPHLGPESFPDEWPDSFHANPAIGIDWGYIKKRWGYKVPYIETSPVNIHKIFDKPWVRRYPDDITSSCIIHYDGYLHDVKPSLTISARAVVGENLTVFVTIPNPQTDIFSPQGNNGGVVSISEVLGIDVKIGFTLYEITNAGAWIAEDHFCADSPILDEDDEGRYQAIVQIDTNFAIPSGSYKRYAIVPWAVDKDKGYAGTSLIAGSKFYSLCFGKNFVEDSYIEIEIFNQTVAITKVEITLNPFKFKVTFRNTLGTPQTLSSFSLRARNADGTVYDVQLATGSLKATVVPADGTLTVELTCSNANASLENDYKNNNLIELVVRAVWNGKTIESWNLAGIQHAE